MNQARGQTESRIRLAPGLRWGAALLLAGVAAWLSVRQVQWATVVGALTQARLPLLVLALGTVLATTAAKAARWRVLLRPCRAQASGGRVLRVLLIGQMGNNFLPRLGDVARAVLLGPRATGGIPAVLGTILVEKALDGVMGLLILVGLALGTPLPDWLRGPVLGLAALTGGLLLLTALAAARLPWASRLYRQLTGWLPGGLRDRVEGLLTGLGLGLGLLRQPTNALLALALSAVIWGLAAWTNAATLAALGLEAPGWSIWLVLVTGYAATFLPTVPAQIGVFEYAAVLSLTAAGVEPGVALAFGLVLHLLVYAPPAVLGPVSMAVEGLTWGRLRAAQQVYRARGGVSPPPTDLRSALSPPGGKGVPHPHPDPPPRRGRGLGGGSGSARATIPSPTPALPPRGEGASGKRVGFRVEEGRLVSVIVPVWNGAETLGACLDALAAQTVEAERYEIIVVDDGSSDGSAEAAARRGVTVLRQEHAGAAAARNRGAQRARGDILLFTDADCEPLPDWIEAMLAPFADAEVVGVKGVYRTRQRSLVARFTQAEYEEKYDRLARAERIDFVDTYAAAYRRDLFAHDGFDPDFLLDEDQEFSFRLAAAGRKLVFAPAARVYHRHPTTVWQYARRKAQLGRWKVRVHARHPARALRDSYTPWTQKAQLLLLPLAGGLALAAALRLVPWAVVAGIAGLGLVSATLLLVKAARQGWSVALVTPGLVLVRALALDLGLAWGLVDSLSTRIFRRTPE